MRYLCVNNDENILEVKDLSVAFDGRTVVERVSYTLGRGKTLGVVGESGSGKSVSTLALMGLLPKNATVTGHAWLAGKSDLSDRADLLTLGEAAKQGIRGNRISMIFQEPMTSLNPVQKCGAQVAEMLRLHEKVSHEEARRRVIDLFGEVLLPRPEKIYDSYPHEISGGQKQRVMIAMALICHPDILIADEPTTALDVTVQKPILELLQQLQERYGIGIIFITHDLGVVAQIADDVAVMYHGKVVEHGPAAQVLYHPSHPYTQGLLACRPPLDSRPRHLPTVEEFLKGREAIGKMDTIDKVDRIEAIAGMDPNQTNPSTPLVSVRDLSVTYPLKRSLFGKPLQQLNAVDGISFDIMEGETLGLVGESGCGKSTLGRALLRLISHSSGSILYRGRPLDTFSAKEMRALRSKMQIVFQDPYSSLNPRLTVGEAISEPLKVHSSRLSRESRMSRVLELMQQVGLAPDCYDRYPHEFSGGQRQRVCIARALVLQPELLVCDESVSALDVSVQAQVLNLLNDLKVQYGYTYLFITHDLSVVKFLSDRIMVMEKGRIVESGPADRLYAHPEHPYTQRLIAAIPRM